MTIQEYIDKYYNSDKLLPELIQQVWNDACEATQEDIAKRFSKIKQHYALATPLEIETIKKIGEGIKDYSKPELK